MTEAGNDPSQADARLSVCGGHLVLDLNLRCVFVNDDRINLTKLEFDLLLYLAYRAGRVVSIAELLVEVWKFQPDLQVASAPVKNCVRRLRSKIEPNPAQPQYVITVFGHGYIVPVSPRPPSVR